MTFPDKFIDQDKPDLMYQIAGLDSKAIEEKIGRASCRERV